MAKKQPAKRDRRRTTGAQSRHYDTRKTLSYIISQAESLNWSCKFPWPEKVAALVKLAEELQAKFIAEVPYPDE